MKKQNNDIFGVACAHYLCPICGKPMDHSIIMNTKLTKASANRVNDLHNKALSWSNKPCDDCKHYINNGVFFVIGVDVEKSTDDSFYRSGHIVGVKKESNFYKNLDEKYKSRGAMYMDVKAMLALGLIQQI